MNRLCSLLLFFSLGPVAIAAEFKAIGDYQLQAHFKLTGQQMTQIPIKPVVFHVSTDGVQIRVSTTDDEDAFASFEIYRSDGVGRTRNSTEALEVIPGLQAMSHADGTLRHLCISRESMTLTTFPGLSDQTLVSFAIAAHPQPKSPHSYQASITPP